MVAIFVALMFIGFVLLDLIIHQVKVRRAEAAWKLAAEKTSGRMGPGRSQTLDPRLLPDGVYLSEHHAWFAPQQPDRVLVGADALVSHALGAPTRVVLPSVGDHVSSDQPLFRLEVGDRTVTIPSPVTGRIVSLNNNLSQKPALLADSPYGDGWVCSIHPTRLNEEKQIMRLAESAAAWLRSEFNRYREFISARPSPDLALGFTSQDGGTPVGGSMTHLDRDTWSDFEREFLRPQR